MNIEDVKKKFEEKRFKHSFIKKEDTFQFESFLAVDLPFFWDAVHPSNKRFHLFGKQYFNEKMLAVVLFKTKKHYYIAYSDDVHKINSDIVSIPVENFDQYIEKILDVDSRCTMKHEEKRQEFQNTLKSFLNYK